MTLFETVWFPAVIGLLLGLFIMGALRLAVSMRSAKRVELTVNVLQAISISVALITSAIGYLVTQWQANNEREVQVRLHDVKLSMDYTKEVLDIEAALAFYRAAQIVEEKYAGLVIEGSPDQLDATNSVYHFLTHFRILDERADRAVEKAIIPAASDLLKCVTERKCSVTIRDSRICRLAVDYVYSLKSRLYLSRKRASLSKGDTVVLDLNLDKDREEAPHFRQIKEVLSACGRVDALDSIPTTPAEFKNLMSGRASASDRDSIVHQHLTVTLSAGIQGVGLGFFNALGEAVGKP